MESTQRGTPGPDQIPTRQNILLVDDEPSVLTLASLILRNAKYECITATSGIEAMEIFEEGPRVDALVSDIRMPGMDGFELGHLLRKISPKLPILYISGFPEYNDSDRTKVFLEPGIHFRPKPFSPRQLLESLDTLLSSGPDMMPNGKRESR